MKKDRDEERWHTIKKTNVENKSQTEGRRSFDLRDLPAALLRSLVVTLCVWTFVSRAVYAPMKLMTAAVTRGQVFLLAAVWMLLCIGCLQSRFLRDWCVPAALAVTGCASLIHGGGAGLAAVFVFLIRVSFPGRNKEAGSRQQRKTPDWSLRRLCLVMTASAGFFLLFAGSITTLRYLNFHAPCFDFGIFCQMFEQMRLTGLPVTTCERGQSLSHFAIHLSPSLYFLLPFYCLWPHPLTLVWLQVLGLAFGFLPLAGLCRHYGLSRRTTGWVCAAYAVYPALSGGCFYDFHENFLLTPFLFTFLFLAEKECWRYAVPTALCVLGVKEDAAIYLACVCVYLVIRDENGGRPVSRRFWPAALLAVSVLYFFGAVAYISSQGMGTLAAVHYRQYLPDGGGLGEILTAVLGNPLYVLWASFQTGRWLYLAQMFVPLLLIPLLGCHPKQLFLLAPMLLFNLMTDYRYQHDIHFQYQFGTLALLFYMTVQNLAEVRKETLRYRMTAAMAAIGLILLIVFHGNYLNLWNQWQENRAVYEQMETVLEEAREEAKESGQTVAASTMLVSHLWQTEKLYEEDSQKTNHKVQMVILDLRYENNESRLSEYLETGYRIRAEVPGYLVWLSAPTCIQTVEDTLQ